jgi:hypothetical protein
MLTSAKTKAYSVPEEIKPDDEDDGKGKLDLRRKI